MLLQPILLPMNLWDRLPVMDGHLLSLVLHSIHASPTVIPLLQSMNFVFVVAKIYRLPQIHSFDKGGLLHYNHLQCKILAFKNGINLISVVYGLL